MSVDIYTHRVKNYEELWVPGAQGDKVMEPITFAMGRATVHTGMPVLTERNKGEYLRRLRVVEQVHGAQVVVGLYDRLFTEADVDRRIGLVTNAPELTRRAFERNMALDLKERL